MASGTYDVTDTTRILNLTYDGLSDAAEIDYVS